MENSQKNNMCEHCTELKRKNRGQKPHKFLVSTRYVPFSYEGKTANEHYYECSICGHEWLHETGNCGSGWVE